MNKLFKLRELHLTIYSSAHLLQELVEKINLLLIGSMSQGVFQKQIFISRRGYLSAENSVLRVHIALILGAIVAVQGVTNLVSNSGNAAVALLIVKQYEGMHAIDAPGIGTGALALVFININPSTGQALMQRCHIILAQGS